MDLYSPTWEKRRAGSSRRGWKCHHKAGRAGSVTSRQEGLEVSPQAGAKARRHQVSPQHHHFQSSSKVSDWNSPSSLLSFPFSLPLSLPSPGRDYKNSQRWMQTVGCVHKNKSINLPLWDNRLRAELLLHRAPGLVRIPLPTPGLCLLPAIPAGLSLGCAFAVGLKLVLLQILLLFNQRCSG